MISIRLSKCSKYFICFLITLVLLTSTSLAISMADDDFDTLQNGDEITMGTNPSDADTDNDGIRDGDEEDWDVDSDGDGEWKDNLWIEGNYYNDGINALDSDSDNDGIPDGTEFGVVDGHSHTYYNSISDDPNDKMYEYPVIFQEGEAPDKDSNTTTNHLLNDTDGDGLFDGWEDLNNNSQYDSGEEVGEDINANGKIDEGEIDPNLSDTDGGGVDDGTEVTMGTDPLDSEDDYLAIDSDGDGYYDNIDKFPYDAAASRDSDNDGHPGKWNKPDPEDETKSLITTTLDYDEFPNNASEWDDYDGDGYGDNTDEFDDNPAAWRDTDCDGMPDELDKRAENPTNLMEDSDDENDGMADWWEENYEFDPKDPSDALKDADGDGYTNLEEYREGTNPRDKNDPTVGGDQKSDPNDTDKDGLPDDWETTYFGDLSQDGNGDYDNDNYTNKQEQKSGSNPINPRSIPTETGSGDDDMPIFIWVVIIAIFIVIIVIIISFSLMKKKKIITQTPPTAPQSYPQVTAPQPQPYQEPQAQPQYQPNAYPQSPSQPPQAPGSIQSPEMYTQEQYPTYQPTPQSQLHLAQETFCPICRGERQYYPSVQKWYCPRCQT